MAESKKQVINLYENTWKPITIHCPNCGTITTGYKNNEGTVKLECRICRVTIIYKQMGRRHDRIDIYALEGQERLG
jgi:ribosomal protein S27E